MFDFAAQLSAIYAGPLALPAWLGGVAGRVMFDAPGSVVDGMVLTEPSCRLMASTWPAARPDDVLTLQPPGATTLVQYSLREILPLDEGAERRFVLARR